MLLVPLALRGLAAIHPPPNLQASYLPALEGPRPRDPFEESRLTDLASLQPAFVVIGDSMAGSRIDPAAFTRASGRLVAPLLHAGSGPSWWYLVLKNWVIASGIHPKAVFVFFRDTNLTNVLFRIDASSALDTAALAREDELNAVVARRRGRPLSELQTAIDEASGAAPARRRAEAAVQAWPARAMIPYRRPRAAFMWALNERFGLGHLRPMEAADIQATEDREADFDGFVDKSTLPLMLADARRAGLRLVFVRVQRRPSGGVPPDQSPALRRYVARLRAYIEDHGGVLLDDTGDPDETLDQYEDGDHLSPEGRRRYSERFALRAVRQFP